MADSPQWFAFKKYREAKNKKLGIDNRICTIQVTPEIEGRPMSRTGYLTIYPDFTVGTEVLSLRGDESLILDLEMPSNEDALEPVSIGISFSNATEQMKTFYLTPSRLTIDLQMLESFQFTPSIQMIVIYDNLTDGENLLICIPFKIE